MRRVGAFTIEIASLPDRDVPVAEIWLRETQVAEVRLDSGEVRVQIYTPTEGTILDFGFEDWLNALLCAKSALLGE